MRSLLFFAFSLSTIICHASLTLITREPFIGPGSLTSNSPGQNFSSVSGTLTTVRVGPRTSAIASPGWSADVRTTGPVNYRGTVNLSGSAATCGMWGAWIRIKALPPAGGYMSVLQLLDRSTNVVMDFTLNASGVISFAPYDYGGSAPTFTSPVIQPNTWVWLAVAWQIQAGSNFPYGIRCMSMPLGGSLTTWGSADGLNALATTFTGVNVGLQTGGSGPMLRIGCPTLYAMSSFADIAYPSDIIPPVEQSYGWYVNALSGNDNNDGSTAATAWKTAAKITTESQYCGMLDSNAPGPGGGDVLTIDTSGTPLVLGQNTLTFATQGLKVEPVSGQTYIRCQAEEFLSNSAFTLAPGRTQTYQTADTQSDVVAWENDEWMWHVKSASYGASASITNPQTGITTDYTSTGAALDAVPGSFYTDGTNLYIHPFGNTNPSTDNQVYTRSINRNQLAAVAFTAGNFRAIGFYVRKTTLVDSGDNDFGAYCFQDGVLAGAGFSSSVESSYFGYGDKHCFGSTAGVTNSSLLVLNTECEQGNPYCGYGGQSPFVSFTGATTGDIQHTYRGCTCKARSGLIGSTMGDPVGTGGDIILSHNNGIGNSFGSITLDDCNFASGSATLGVATNLYLTDQTQIGLLNTSCPTTTVQQTLFSKQLVTMDAGAKSLIVQNCLIKPTFALAASPPYYGFLLAGTAIIEGCTFDLTGITGNSSAYFQQGIIQRTGALNLTFRNNAYVVPAGQSLPLLYGALSTDTLVFDHNAYDLGAGTVLVHTYNNGISSSDLSFAQWQAIGEDSINSSLNSDLLLSNDAPQAGSPLLNAGLNLGSMADYTGTVYANRNTIGAYQGSSAYLALQTISNFPALQTETATTSYHLPATTSAGLTITYTLISGPGILSGDTLTFSGTGDVVLKATQTGNGVNAPLTQTESINVVSASTIATDTPTMPVWALIVLACLLGVSAKRSLLQA